MAHVLHSFHERTIVAWLRAYAARGYHFVEARGGRVDQAGYAVRDHARGFDVLCLTIREAMDATRNPDRFAHLIMRRLGDYVRLVDAFEGRRPLVWS